MNFIKLLTIPTLLLLVITTPNSATYATNNETQNSEHNYSSIISEIVKNNRTVVKTEKVEFDTRVEKDSILPEGVEIVVQEGKNGTKTYYRTYDNTKNTNGENVTVPVISDEITVLPVEKVIRKGTNTEIIDGISEKTKKIEKEKADKLAKEAEAKKLAESVRTYSTKTNGNYTSESENREYAKSVLNETEFECADKLVNRESGWKTNATNPSSGAYGVPQSLPGNKMASAGSDWQTNGKTQFNWMISYVNGRYGNFCKSLDFSYSNGWY